MHNPEKGDRYVEYHDDDTPKYAEMGYRRDDYQRVGGKLNDIEREKKEQSREMAKKILYGVAVAAAAIAVFALAGHFDAETNAPFTKKDQDKKIADNVTQNTETPGVEFGEDGNVTVTPDDLVIPPVPVSPSSENIDSNSSDTPQE